VSNPVRGRLNAAVLLSAQSYDRLLVGRRKLAMFASLPDTVVEIGPGTGTNFRYYRAGTTVIAIEPNPHMHGSLRKAAKKHRLNLDLRAEGAERTGLPDASTDVVVSTLVLCTVPDQAAALAEIVRVLRPGGRLLFVEHVHAGGLYGAIQKMSWRPWHWLFEGCDVSRDTAAALDAAGFASLTVEHYRLRSVLLPMNPQISGQAVR
jgi:SAM-dependent methyltransferase